RVNDVHSGDGLPRVLGVGDRVTDHVLEEHFQHSAPLRKSDRIYVSRRPASETTDSRLGDALDVIAEHFPVTLRSTFPSPLPPFPRPVILLLLLSLR
ncbi:hypothetical protein EVAR_77069_1, partial [Eumeta japonica]